MNVVAHNISSMFSNRQLGITTNNKAKSSERLSSGYKINRAADDAAGLSISEKMRKQIRGLSQASDNCQDGISLVQVADGALTETHDILQRMNELCVKAANGTNSSSDRSDIQNEIAELKEEVDRIANTTSFNDAIFPLRGDSVHSLNSISIYKTMDDVLNLFENRTLIVSGNHTVPEGMSYSIDGVSYNYSHSNVGGNGTITGILCRFDGRSYCIFGEDVNQGGPGNPDTGTYYTPPDKWYHISGSDRYNGQSLYSTTVDDIHADDEGYIYYADHNGQKHYITIEIREANHWGISDTPREDTLRISVDGGTGNNVTHNNTLQSTYYDNIEIQAGADNLESNRIGLHLVNATCSAIGIAGLDVSTIEGARNGIDEVATAIKTVSGYRSYFGAVQNRMEHTIKNLDNVVENTSAAESRIRDTDMALEMVKFSKESILQQAGQSMLAQANQQPQGILSLLQ